MVIHTNSIGWWKASPDAVVSQLNATLPCKSIWPQKGRGLHPLVRGWDWVLTWCVVCFSALKIISQVLISSFSRIDSVKRRHLFTLRLANMLPWQQPRIECLQFFLSISCFPPNLYSYSFTGETLTLARLLTAHTHTLTDLHTDVSPLSPSIWSCWGKKITFSTQWSESALTSSPRSTQQHLCVCVYTCLHVFVCSCVCVTFWVQSGGG